MKSHRIIGGGGTQLHVVETGNPNGRPILFIHGFSQCWRAWSRQLNSDLAEDHRLLAMDMRGHGLSDKPRDAYADSKLWADDVNANLGHAPFWQDAPAFNRALRLFCQKAAGASSVG
jgi:pimeloyl-ACP methyl ester carboxylesterase